MFEALYWGRRITTRPREFPGAVLALVDERQGSRFCVFCREAKIETPEDEPIEIDHKQPLSKGGDNHHMNLQWACRAHNRSRGNRKTPHAIPPFDRGPSKRRKRRKKNASNKSGGSL